MSAQFRASPAVVQPRRLTTPFIRWSRRAAILSVLGSALAACAAAPAAPIAGPDPSRPEARVPAVGYRATIGSYQRQRPVEPAPWVEQNRRVAPQPGQ